MACNLYLTTEPEHKLKLVFSNAKNFYMLDILELINNMGLDPYKNTSVYLINEEILKIILQLAVLKKVQGIFYIVSQISEPLYISLKKKVSRWSMINDIVLVDNGQFPLHTAIMHLFNEVLFYERFKRIKIMQCSGIITGEDEDDLLSKALSEINTIDGEE